MSRTRTGLRTAFVYPSLNRYTAFGAAALRAIAPGDRSSLLALLLAPAAAAAPSLPAASAICRSCVSATEAAAQGLLEALQAAGFNVAKGHWPADWRRFKGNLHGPQSPAPTDAPIRIVIGNKAR